MLRFNQIEFGAIVWFIRRQDVIENDKIVDCLQPTSLSKSIMLNQLTEYDFLYELESNCIVWLICVIVYVLELFHIGEWRFFGWTGHINDIIRNVCRLFINLNRNQKYFNWIRHIPFACHQRNRIHIIELRTSVFVCVFETRNDSNDDTASGATS